MNLETLINKIDKAYNNKLSRVGKLERITRKLLDETKTEMIEEKEQKLRFLRLKNKTFKYLRDCEEEKEANKIPK